MEIVTYYILKLDTFKSMNNKTYNERYKRAL